MADARQTSRIKEVQADREALEHIARMLEGRVLRGPGLTMSDEDSTLERLKLEGTGLVDACSRQCLPQSASWPTAISSMPTQRSLTLSAIDLSPSCLKRAGSTPSCRAVRHCSRSRRAAVRMSLSMR